MSEDRRVLAIDIGAGTQDILIYDPAVEPENCSQLILPSPTRVLGARVAAATRLGQPVFLSGREMGGGALVGAVRRHLAAGLPVYAHEGAARTIDNDLNRVAGMGVVLCGPGERAPAGAVEIRLADLDLGALEAALRPFEITPPGTVAVAIQDHGYRHGVSNRETRFDFWRGFLEDGGDPRHLLFGGPRAVPRQFSRMRSLLDLEPAAVVMDTGPAAVLGVLEDPEVSEWADRGLLTVNVGNGHAFGVLYRSGRVYGLFEHHTGQIDPAKLAYLVESLRRGTITHTEVYDSGGHGAGVHPDYLKLAPFTFTVVTGPNRKLARDHGWRQATPHGSMMIAGSWGLIRAMRS